MDTSQSLKCLDLFRNWNKIKQQQQQQQQTTFQLNILKLIYSRLTIQISCGQSKEEVIKTD